MAIMRMPSRRTRTVASPKADPKPATAKAAKAPVPPPNSRNKASGPICCSTGANASATQAANTGPSSGAVTKSPPSPNLSAPAL